MLHVPILRAGRPYRSLDRVTLRHVVTGEPVAEVSQANPGLIHKDLLAARENRKKLQTLPARELLAICRRAAELFVAGELPLDPEGEKLQGAEDYVRQLSSTTGMPHTLCRGNMEKIHFVLHEMETVLAGLTRGLDLEALDTGWVEEDGRCVAYRRETDSLGAVLPSNSPGVHSLWIPAIALKVPVVLKPGRQEPWTPFRVSQALIASGCPPEALSFYPSSHAGATEILLASGRSMLFGDRSTVKGWADDPRIQLHGPGWSKVLVGDDHLSAWKDHLELVATSAAANGGRSCINASGLWVAGRGREIAGALAEKLAAIEARPLDHPKAALAAFSDPAVARAISDFIDSQLAIPGAEDLSIGARGPGRESRVVEAGGCTYLLPTVVWCEEPSHPLAEAEFLFPFISVVEVPQREMADLMGPSLVVTALAGDPEMVADLLDSPKVDRLNLSPVPTSRVDWHQPHEGNLFEHLYRQRALQTPGFVPGGGESRDLSAGGGG